MNVLDLIIIVLALAYGFAGFRSGALVGICSLIGFLGGAVIGAQLARPLGSHFADGRAQVPVAVVCVLVCAMAGQLAAVFLAGLIRNRLLAGRARPLDAGIGAVLGVLSVLLVSWMIAVPLASSPFPKLAAEASQSRIVRAVNDAVPDELRHVYSSLRTFLDQSGFPPVLGDLPSTSLVPVDPPSDLSPVGHQDGQPSARIGGEDLRTGPVLRPADRGLRLRVRAAPGAHQRPRRRGHRPGECAVQRRRHALRQGGGLRPAA